jgi:SNF2 family DNA or RNA helicase
MNLNDFVDEFGESLIDSLNTSNPPAYSGSPDISRAAVMNGLKRLPFEAQADAVQAVSALLLDQGSPAAILNAEMGTGKTMMAIATAAIMHSEGYQRSLVLSPPHLVYKWRREILDTIPNARVWCLNGPDTLAKLIKLKELLGIENHGQPEFYILGRVRMRMGFHWRPVCAKRRLRNGVLAVCPDCGTPVTTPEGDGMPYEQFIRDEKRLKCGKCKAALWTLQRPYKAANNDAQRNNVSKALQRLPTIGKVTSEKLMDTFGQEFLSSMLADNIFEFINLMDASGEMVFSDRQAARMERAMSTIEFGFGEGGYQPTEFIKRYLPNNTFDLLIVDEGHEYKNHGSAQGQAMGVLADKVPKILLLTGTLMGGYADDLFFLLFRVLTRYMIEDGYRPSKNGSLGSAAMSFMRDHGVLKEVYSETIGEEHKTAKGNKVSVRTVKAPGFGPKGIHRYVLPFTVFLKLKDIGGELPSYEEEFMEVAMTFEQESFYRSLSSELTTALRKALAARDTTLLGVVLNSLLAWPDCSFRPEIVKHPRTKQVISSVESVFSESEIMPKEEELLNICLSEKAQGRKVLAYSTYTGTRDTTARLKRILEQRGLKVAVLKASIGTDRREDWIANQVDKGIDVLVCNPELVKTGLDLLDFPTIVFMQTGFNVYTLLQASRRSWRIGQKFAVRVIFLGYEGTSQIMCLSLMAAKIAVAQSTSGDIPESGLDSLNAEVESVEVALAKQLAA